MDIKEANEALVNGAFQGNADKVAEALENGADVNFHDRHGDTALHGASCCRPFLEICKILIEHGADIDARESNGMTALHLAARDGNVEIGRYLLEQGAKVDAVDITDKTPLFTALEEGNYDFCKLLLKYGADPNYECKHEELTSLELAELYAKGEEYPQDDYAEPKDREQYAEMAKFMKSISKN